jgi:hypothetical protein
MEYLKKFHPDMHLEDGDIRRFANGGDTLFDQEFNFPIEERDQFDMEGRDQQTIQSCIEHLLHDEHCEDASKQSEENGDDEEDDESSEEDQGYEEDEDCDEKEET